MKSQFFPNRVFWRLDLATGLSREFKPWANDLVSLGLLSYNAIVGTTLQLLACLARVQHFGGLQPRATHKIQPRVPTSLHNLEQFFTLFYSLPLHDSYLNTRLLIAKIQANLARNKTNKIVDKIQPYKLCFFITLIWETRSIPFLFLFQKIIYILKKIKQFNGKKWMETLIEQFET